MAIVAMLGFDDRAVQTGLQTTNTLFNIQFPMLFKSPINNITISLMQYLGSYMTNMAYISRLDPDGNPTVTLTPYANTSVTSANVAQQYLMGPPVADTTLDKTGTWVFGAMVYVPYLPNGNAVMAMIGDMDDRSKNVPIAAYALGSPTLNNISASNAYYVEFVIDWVNKRLEGWLDGVLVNTTTFTTTPIAYIGNAQTAQYYLSSGTTSSLWQTAWANQQSPTLQLGFGHIYFAINKANEANPTPRLGPVRVRNVDVVAVDSVGDMAPQGTADNVTVANTAITYGSVPAVSTTLDTGGGKAVYHFATPVLNSNEETIRAFQMDVYTFKQRDAAANSVLSFGDGTNASQDYFLTQTESIRRESLCLDKPYGDGAWTPTTVGKMQVKLNSVSNS